MSKEELLLEYWRDLPLEQRRELVNFAEFLHTKTAARSARPNIKGLCADIPVDLSLEDFTQARQETWADWDTEIVARMQQIQSGTAIGEAAPTVFNRWKTRQFE
jgi:hypothetical protein